MCACVCLQVRRQLRAAKLHVDVDLSDRTMQKKVREAQLAQYNYILVVGEQEKVRATGVRALVCWRAMFLCLRAVRAFVKAMCLCSGAMCWAVGFRGPGLWS